MMVAIDTGRPVLSVRYRVLLLEGEYYGTVSPGRSL